MPKAYLDVPTIEPTIKKATFQPKMWGGLPKADKAAAMAPKYKCYDCGGVRVYGVGATEKARVGFTGQKFYFCKACGRVLLQEERAADSKKIAVRKQNDPSAPGPFQ